MSPEKVSQGGPETDKNEALKLNLNTLIEVFLLNDRTGRYDDVPEFDDAVVRVIQAHTVKVENGYNRIGDPEAFLADLHAARDRALEAAADDAEREKITELFGHVDIV